MKFFSEVHISSVVPFNDLIVEVLGYPTLAHGYYVTDGEGDRWIICFAGGEWFSYLEGGSQSAEGVSSPLLQKIKNFSSSKVEEEKIASVWNAIDSISPTTTITPYRRMVEDLRKEGMAAYRRYAKKTHPDCGGSHEAFLLLQEAAKEAGL